MKTTLEMPDALFRQAKAVAVAEGIPFRELVTRAVREKLQSRSHGDKPWMALFGALRALHKETVRVNKVIESEFGQIEPEDWN